MFQFYSNQFSQATKSVAGWVLAGGIALICFGVLIIALQPIVIFFVAGFFFLIGASVIGYAIRLFITAWRMGTSGGSAKEPDRENVQIHEPGEHS